MKTRTLATAILIGSLVPAWTAHAANFCFDVGVATLVVQRFKPPKPGRCEPFRGAYFSTVQGATTGSACTNTAGNMLRVGFSLEGGNGSLVGALNIPYPSLTGGSYRYELSKAPDSVQTFTGSASGAFCAAPVAIP